MRLLTLILLSFFGFLVSVRADSSVQIEGRISEYQINFVSIQRDGFKDTIRDRATLTITNPVSFREVTFRILVKPINRTRWQKVGNIVDFKCNDVHLKNVESKKEVTLPEAFIRDVIFATK